MLVFSFTKAQPIRVTIGDDSFVYIWYDTSIHKWKIGISTQDKEVFREKIDIEKHFREMEKHRNE